MKDVIAPIHPDARFSADVAHELRTPIAASRILAQLALNSQDIHRCHEYLKDILKGLDRTSMIISQIQLVTGVHPEQVLQSRIQIPLRSLLQTLTQDLLLTTQKKVSIDIQVPDDICVFANEGCLLIVMRNIIDNAMRYAGDEPHIILSAAHQGEKVSMAVTDNGPGIPPDLRSMVFNRFYRGANTGQSGTGLGLSIVELICDVHGGSVTLQDAKGGKGLTVLVTL